MALMRLVTETEDPSTLETAQSEWHLPAMRSRSGPTARG
jgi:hypothetical protein